MIEFIKGLITDAENNPSVSRSGYFLAIVTSILWINIILGTYVYNAFKGIITPDIPSQVVFLVMTILGGYLGSKGTDIVNSHLQARLENQKNNPSP